MKKALVFLYYCHEARFWAIREFNASRFLVHGNCALIYNICTTLFYCCNGTSQLLILQGQLRSQQPQNYALIPAGALMRSTMGRLLPDAVTSLLPLTHSMPQACSSTSRWTSETDDPEFNIPSTLTLPPLSW